MLRPGQAWWTEQWGAVPEGSEHPRQAQGGRRASVQFPPLLCLPGLTVGCWDTLPPGSEESSKPSPHFGREGPVHTWAKTFPHHEHGQDCSPHAFQFKRPRRNTFPILSGILTPAAPANVTPVPTFTVSSPTGTHVKQTPCRCDSDSKADRGPAAGTKAALPVKHGQPLPLNSCNS